LGKKLLWLLALFLGFASASTAQQTPSWEFFGGYSFARAGVREYYKSTPVIYTFRDQYINLNGWELSVTENVNRWFSGTLQVTGHYSNPVVLGTKNQETNYAVLYGPRFSRRTGRGRPYGHVLLGIGHAAVKVSPGPKASDTSFALAAGGGLDLTLGPKAAVRALQIQYLPTNQLSTKSNRVQISAGVVFYVGAAR
jgi:hypothetical protein